MSNLDLLSAGFTAIFGKHWQHPQRNGKPFSVHNLFAQTYIMGPPLESVDSRQLFDVFVRVLTGEFIAIPMAEVYTIAQVKAAIKMKRYESDPPISEICLFDMKTGTPMEDTLTLSDYGINDHGARINMVLKLRGGGDMSCHTPRPYRLETDELDPRYDYDFSKVQDDGKTYMRGGFVYRRPYGWKRLAIKVVGRYENDEWLGPNGIRTEQASGEWPVSYHGTNIMRANQITKKGFKPGPRALYGKGIYTSPSLEMVEKLYAQEFTHEGKSYKIVLQNRVNPNRLQVINASQTGVGADYWLSQSGNDVRPYGVLIRKV
ncbi:uncharacterized protein LOC144654773 [Oculina patagonica]